MGVISQRILIGVGLLMLVCAAVTYGYTVTEQDEYLGGLITDTDVSTPYRQFTWPLIIGGFILILIGALFRKEGKT